ncbi:MAG: RecQ family ATP-dependent DNA helicase [Bacteroidales bacterium]|nr:RecQ family ATP-dependent DNA helicase [Bacteroidales bacterium]
MDTTPGEILKKYWGYESFRPRQLEIIDSALQGRDTLAILPTGGGKSICFQVPALMKEGLCLVVTPLISLMKDQVQNLASRGILAIAVHAGMTPHEVDLALNNAAYGGFKFLYLSPERLSTFLFRKYLSVMNVSFIVVDEAHCISQWGYDFRPNYLEIAQIREFTDAPVLALTATATPRVADDIMENLKFKAPNIICGGFSRENLSYIVRRCEDKNGQILAVCRGVSGSGIVYVRNRRMTEELARMLESQGISATFYHAGLTADLRSERQNLWKSGGVQVMVATNAFGMGIDKPDVRFVVHYDLPDSPEAYFQEAGRGGRDGKPSYAVLLWNNSDIDRLRQIQRVSFPSLEYIEDIYHKVHVFYGIPYEEGMGRQLKFDLQEFCRKFSLFSPEVYYAIKYIEREGHWTLAEDLDVQTKVKFEVDRGALYSIDLPSPAMVPLLEILMRRYEGIFSFPSAIDEEQIAAQTGVTVPMLREMLYTLSVNHIIRYIPQAKANVLFIAHNRLYPGNLQLSPKRYALLKGAYSDRVEAMKEYVAAEEGCRASILLRYFGEEPAADCGCCDLCRERARREKDSAGELQSFIESRGGVYTLGDIKAAFPTSSAAIFDTLRGLIDSGTVPPYKH